MPVVGSPTRGNDYRTAIGPRSIGVKLRCAYGELLHGVRRKVLQEAANEVIVVVPAVHG